MPVSAKEKAEKAEKAKLARAKAKKLKDQKKARSEKAKEKRAEIRAEKLRLKAYNEQVVADIEAKLGRGHVPETDHEIEIATRLLKEAADKADKAEKAAEKRADKRQRQQEESEMAEKKQRSTHASGTHSNPSVTIPVVDVTKLSTPAAWTAAEGVIAYFAVDGVGKLHAARAMQARAHGLSDPGDDQELLVGTAIGECIENILIVRGVDPSALRALLAGVPPRQVSANSLLPSIPGLPDGIVGAAGRFIGAAGGAYFGGPAGAAIGASALGELGDMADFSWFDADSPEGL